MIDNVTEDEEWCFKDITVTLLDTKTNKTAIVHGWSYYWWEEGNGSCDCNREMYFYSDDEEEEGEEETDLSFTCIGCHRYLIIETTAGDLFELNSGYPPELLKEHGII